MSNSEHAPNLDPLASILARIKHLDISDRLPLDKDARFISGGSYGDVRLGTYNHPDRGEIRVATKHLRAFLARDPENLKIIGMEVRAWSKLNHPNILPLLGYILDENRLPVLVSEYMESGTALKYVTRHPDVDVISMILGIAEGVSYLHNRGVVHSDLKSDNILISKDGKPLICDFGISRRIFSLSTTVGGNNMYTNSSTTGSVRGSIRWMAPEILFFTPDEKGSGKHTIESDVWAFGMVAYELLCKEVPYHEFTNEQALGAIATFRVPEQPKEYYSWSWSYRTVWELCRVCWSKNPADRPGMPMIIWILSAANTSIEIVAKMVNCFRIPCPKCFEDRTYICNCSGVSKAVVEYNEDEVSRSVSGELNNSNDNSGPLPSRNLQDKETERKSELDKLDESVKHLHNQLALISPNDPYRTEPLINLADTLYNRFQQVGEMQDFQESIEHLHSAINLCPEGSLDRIEPLEKIALCFSARFKRNGDKGDLRQTATYYRIAAFLCPEDNPERSRLLRQAWYWVDELYERTGRDRDLEEAISMIRACLALRPQSHDQRYSALINLAFSLGRRFMKKKRDEDIDEVIVLYREALSLCPEGHTDRGMTLSDLGNSLFRRHRHRDQLADLEESIVLFRAALVLRPEGHTNHVVALRFLANALDARFKRLGDAKDSEEVATLRQADRELGEAKQGVGK